MQDETSPLLGEGSINTGANAGKGKKSVWTALNIVVLASCLFVTLCQSLLISIVAPFFPQEAKDDYKASSTTVGLVFATFPITVFVITPLVAPATARFGRMTVLLAGLAIMAGATIGFGYSNTIWLFFIMRFLQGVGACLANATSTAILTIQFPDNTGLVMGLVETAGGLGFMVGPPVGGALYSAGGFTLPFLVMGLLCVLPLVLIPFAHSK
eukprot:Colp12_sorted_trinity150504_noHs@12698